MNEDQVNQLKEALRIIMKMVIQKGEPLNSELKSMLGQVVEHVGSRIEKLRSEESPADGLGSTGRKDLPKAPYESSNIHAFKYDPKSQRLIVQFQDKYPFTNGPQYVYEGVPKFLFNVFARGAVAPHTSGKNKWHEWIKGITPSLGAAMNALIKLGNYPYQRLA